MTPFSNKEEDLVQFLRRNRSQPPAVALDLEPRLMERIRQVSQERPERSLPWRWVMPFALATGALITWGGVQQWQSARQIAVNAREIEDFMVENWHETLSDPSLTTSLTHSAREWANLTEPETVFVGSYP